MKTNKKNNGIIRRIDSLGRVVIPKEIRKIVSLKEGDAVEIGLQNGIICLQKPHFECRFCTNILTEQQLDSEFKICLECQEKIKSL